MTRPQGCNSCPRSRRYERTFGGCVRRPRKHVRRLMSKLRCWARHRQMRAARRLGRVREREVRASECVEQAD